MLVRWYLAFALSYRNIEELPAERGLFVDHSTINRWVIKYAPQQEEAFRKKHKHPVGASSSRDETYLRLKGKWIYLYREVDKSRSTIDFMLPEKRDTAAPRAFLKKALKQLGLSHTVTIDKCGPNIAGLKSVIFVITSFSRWNFVSD